MLTVYDCGGVSAILINGDYYYYFLHLGVKIPRVKSKVKSKRKAEVVTPRR